VTAYVSGRSWIPVLGGDDVPELFVVPLVHRIYSMIASVSRPLAAHHMSALTQQFVVFPIQIQIPLLHLPPDIQIVTELALIPLLAVSRLVEPTQHRLRVHTERHLLRLRGLKQSRLLFLPLLLIEIGLLAQSLFFFFVERGARFAC
jgi:hypothetical protein